MKIRCSNCNKNFDNEKYYGICPKCGSFNRIRSSQEEDHMKYHQMYDGNDGHSEYENHEKYHDMYDNGGHNEYDDHQKYHDTYDQDDNGHDSINHSSYNTYASDTQSDRTSYDQTQTKLTAVLQTVKDSVEHIDDESESEERYKARVKTIKIIVFLIFLFNILLGFLPALLQFLKTGFY